MAGLALNPPIVTGPGGIPTSEPTPGLDSAAAGELGAGIRPNRWEKFFSQAALGLMDAPVGFGIENEGEGGALIRLANQYRAGQDAEAAGSLKLSSDEANKRYPGLPEPFSEPVYPEVAQLIADHNERRQRLQAWVSRGPETGWAFNLASGAVAGADPINLAVAGLLGVGSRALGLAKGLGTAARVGLTYGENFAANLAGEIPGAVARPLEHQESMTTGEIVGGAASGAAVGTGIHLAFDAALRKALQVIRETPQPVIKQNVETAVKLHETDHGIDVAPSAVLQAVRDAGHVAPGIENPYQFRELGHPGETHYFVPMDPETGSFHVSQEQGGAVLGVDNRAVANNMAGYPESEFTGKVAQARLAADANLLGEETPFREIFGKGNRDAAFEKFKGILGDDRRWAQVEPALRQLWKDRGTVGDLYQLFSDSPTKRITAFNDVPLADLRRVLDGLGYDGIQFTGKVLDKSIDNRILMFNPEKLEHVATTDADRAAVPQIRMDERQALSDQYQSPERERFADADARDTVRTRETQSNTDVDQGKADTIVAQHEQQARAALEERAKLPGNEHLTEQIEAIDRDSELAKHAIEGVKNLTKCLGGAIV